MSMQGRLNWALMGPWIASFYDVNVLVSSSLHLYFHQRILCRSDLITVSEPRDSCWTKQFGALMCKCRQTFKIHFIVRNWKHHPVEKLQTSFEIILGKCNPCTWNDSVKARDSLTDRVINRSVLHFLHESNLPCISFALFVDLFRSLRGSLAITVQGSVTLLSEPVNHAKVHTCRIKCSRL